MVWVTILKKIRLNKILECIAKTSMHECALRKLNKAVRQNAATRSHANLLQIHERQMVLIKFRVNTFLLTYYLIIRVSDANNAIKLNGANFVVNAAMRMTIAVSDAYTCNKPVYFCCDKKIIEYR